MRRRNFLKACLVAPIPWNLFQLENKIMTVLGEISLADLGTTLIHEHILVDFIGADKISSARWDRKKVRESVLPYLQEAKKAGVQSILDCTPAFLGRDAHLLREISQESGLHILTNTGYYGAAQNKYLPFWAFTETDRQLARRWIREFEKGIDETDVRPGFIKIGVMNGALSPLHQKLVRAAALTHLETGLTICSHTGPAQPAFEELALLKEMGVHPSAFVWVHAQAEANKATYQTAARQGTWVSLDGMGWGDFENYATWLVQLKDSGLLQQVLVSHDAGWYRPGEANPMKEFQGYTHFFDEVWPLLVKAGFTTADYNQLLVKNPAEAFGISIRRS